MKQKFTVDDLNRPLPLSRLKDITLTSGSMETPNRVLSGRMCAMQVVKWLEPQVGCVDGGYHPHDTARYLTSLVASVNDAASDKDRQKLLPWLPALVGLYPSMEDVAVAHEALVHEFGVGTYGTYTVEHVIRMIKRLRPTYRPIGQDRPDPYACQPVLRQPLLGTNKFVPESTPIPAPSAFTSEDEKFLTEVEKGHVKSKVKTLLFAALTLGLVR